MAKKRLVVDLTEIEFIGLTEQARASGLTVENHVRHVLGGEKVEIKEKPAAKKPARKPLRKPARRSARRKKT